MCNPAAAVMAIGSGYQHIQQGRQQRAADQQMRAAQSTAEMERQRQAAEDRMEELRRQQQVERGTEQIDNLFSAFGLQPLAPEEGFEHQQLPDALTMESLEGFLPGSEAGGIPADLQRRLNSSDFKTRVDAVQELEALRQAGGIGPRDFFQNPDFSIFGTESTADTVRDRQDDTGFFDQRRQAFLDFAMPQFQENLARERDQLAFALQRSGLGQSSVAGQRAQDLGHQATQAQQQIAGRAQDHADQARNQMLDLRSNLMEQLQATGDPQQALAGAGERLQAIQQQPSFSPLGQVFEGVAGGLGAFETGRRRGRFGVPLSGFFSSPSTGRGSSRVVGGG